MIDSVESTNFGGGINTGSSGPGEPRATDPSSVVSTSAERAQRPQSVHCVGSPVVTPRAATKISQTVSGLNSPGVGNYAEADRRLMQLRAFAALLGQGLNPKAAAEQLGVPRVTLWRWQKRVADHDLDDATQYPAIRSKLVDQTHNSGRTGAWESLLLIPGVKEKLREIHVATMAARNDSATNDRRTGNMAATLKMFTLEPECPETLKPKLLAGKFPVCLTRFLGKLTPEIEALIRGPKHFQLNGFSGKRDKTIGLPDGSRAYLPAGWVIELDDMSVNQPFWCQTESGLNAADAAAGAILSRQGLYARCLKGGWRAVELIARPRESYTSADILRFLRRFCQIYGKPRKVRIERSVWAAHNIAGFKLQGDLWTEDHYERPAMAAEERQNLTDGLTAIGVEVEYCYSARGKADLEGSFHPLQTYLAGFTRDFLNIGRHAGEFELAAKQLRRVRAGSHHPRDLGFPHQNELLERIQKTFDFVNSLPRKDGTFDEIWTRDTQKWQLTPLSAHDLAAFLPTLRSGTIRGGFVTVTVAARDFDFRALNFAQLGDGYKVYVKLDETEPSLGAAIYNREGLNSSNHDGLKDGDFMGFAEFDVPASTTYAANVPDDLPRYSVEQLYGAGAQADGGALMKQQQKAARIFVRSAFTGRPPGQPAIKAVEARNSSGVNKVQIGGTPTAGPLPEPRMPAAAAPQRPNIFAAPTADEVAKRRARLSRQAQLANALGSAGQ